MSVPLHPLKDVFLCEDPLSGEQLAAVLGAERAAACTVLFFFKENSPELENEVAWEQVQRPRRRGVTLARLQHQATPLEQLQGALVVLNTAQFLGRMRRPPSSERQLQEATVLVDASGDQPRVVAADSAQHRAVVSQLCQDVERICVAVESASAAALCSAGSGPVALAWAALESVLPSQRSPALMGLLLGYPVLYHMEGAANCLAWCNLLHVEAFAAAVHDHDQQALFSFSVPRAVLGEARVAAALSSWRRSMEGLVLREHDVCLPSVNL
eukprot:m.161730 g.161730  ORF g.161730 m.161730 type:complete len:270 (-) comp20979_c0_seq1:34-843(-)